MTGKVIPVDGKRNCGEAGAVDISGWHVPDLCGHCRLNRVLQALAPIVLFVVVVVVCLFQVLEVGYSAGEGL